MHNNPSIFIRLPRLPGKKWWASTDVIQVIEKYGYIKQVSIQTDKRNEQFAVVHFNEWYPEWMKIANKCKPIKIPAIYRKHFNLILFQVHIPIASG